MNSNFSNFKNKNQIVKHKNKLKIMKHKKIVQYGIGIFIIEAILIGIWFYLMKPESDVAFNILQIVLLLFGINLILGILLYVLKKSFSSLFFANSIICPLIFYAVWIMWFTYYA
tara:strand:- start:2174 stop:2515 length:342 start_codon:yes stop_codon:yes gene_type:complete